MSEPQSKTPEEILKATLSTLVDLYGSKPVSPKEFVRDDKFFAELSDTPLRFSATAPKEHLTPAAILQDGFEGWRCAVTGESSASEVSVERFAYDLQCVAIDKYGWIDTSRPGAGRAERGVRFAVLAVEQLGKNIRNNAEPFKPSSYVLPINARYQFKRELREELFDQTLGEAAAAANHIVNFRSSPLFDAYSTVVRPVKEGVEDVKNGLQDKGLLQRLADVMMKADPVVCEALLSMLPEEVVPKKGKKKSSMMFMRLVAFELTQHDSGLILSDSDAEAMRKELCCLIAPNKFFGLDRCRGLF